MKELKYLIGDSSIEKETIQQLNGCVLSPFDDLICDFLDAVSKKILHSEETKEYQDVIALGFWCRKANLMKMRQKYSQQEFRIGKGLAFHIAPSNVPINTYYTLFLGLLSGCRNVVRATSKSFPQINIVADCVNAVLNEKFEEIKKYIYVVQYSKESEWTKFFSDRCMLRIIWGGDETIQNITENHINPRCKEIRFADRYSFAIVDAKAVDCLEQRQLKRLAHDFYNDTYLNDQNACSSPHLIVWLKTGIKDKIEDIKKKFWDAVYQEALKYDLTEAKSTEKYTRLCEGIMNISQICEIRRYGNRIYICKLADIPNDIENIRGQYGIFYEYDGANMEDILCKLTPRTQTCLYYGDVKDKVLKIIRENGLSCVDRIVSIGRSLDISEIWDGYNLIFEMTRVIVNE